MRVFTDAAKQAGGDIKTLNYTSNGRSAESRLLLSVDVPDQTIDLPELGGKITPRIWLKNDNTGRAALSVGIGFFRWVCQNGLYIGVNMFGARIIHRDTVRAHSVLDQLPVAVTQAITDLQSGAATNLLLDTADESVSNPIDVIASLNIGTKAKDKAIYLVATESTRKEDNPNTVWGLYNIVNEACRKNGRSLYRTAVNDMTLIGDIQHLAENQKSA
jgi:hypothetical protein